MSMSLTRRHFLAAGAAATTLSVWPRFARATGSNDTRLLIVLLRGGLDGLHAVIPAGDPQYASLRGRLAVPDARRLDADFALHPALAFSQELYARREWLPIVAVAPPYRQRSHFEAQDNLESGAAATGGASNGWLNRCVAALPTSRALSVSTVMPLILRGPADATTWSPPLPDEVNPILLQHLQRLYAADAVLAHPFGQAMAAQGMQAGGNVARLPQAMAAAARFMAAVDGPRIGFVENAGWDTHAQQAPVLARKLAELDQGLKQFHDGMGGAWARTVVMVVTEFGRTAAVNGTGGTDHGTGTLAMLTGGAVAGGRIAGDWPGLARAQLNEGRDLRATNDLRGVFKGVVGDHLGIARTALDTRVFPDSSNAPAMAGLLRG
ncbi:uncharacterized protein (DUF1501 family) [Pseudoxanthomonas japonensis]|uniref:DUF1501 domain-containing protein n=1 Tax=Pseudoxanthomonas japonensis TaxID=69284 RepID=UPI0028625A1A|nr:DUF1501 domain-containing protein [Pseudoxanthomonas japonensis]MDR7069241.1 uncharacterized protein (DUF1501 family) [Pseudoxanthomonas japonensis]